jgi:hypothetical protein
MNRKKKIRRPAKSTSPDWGKIQGYPVEMYNLASLGPVMGLREGVVPGGVRLWAPAMVRQGGPANVIYMPILFVETYFDLRMHFVAGTNPVPRIIEQGYRSYVQEFIKGSYQMDAVVVPASVPAEQPVKAPVDTPRLEKCPACQASVSHWQAHYPVELIDDSSARDNGAGPVMQWICEIGMPDIREKFPNYEPRRPMDA